MVARNAPAAFQKLITQVFHDFMNGFVKVYIDDHLVFSKGKLSSGPHFETMISRLLESELYASSMKCEFFKKTKLTFLACALSKLV